MIDYLADFEENFCSDSSNCRDNLICGKMISNPNDGVTNFDNFLSSFLMVF